MKKGIVAIYEEDIYYANRLMDFLNAQEEFLLETVVFSKKESLQEYLSEHQITILLLSEWMDRSDLKNEHIKYKIVLCEGILVKEEETEQVINKYQSAEHIMREILAFYVSKETLPFAYRYLPQYRNCEMISVYSPCGGSSKTTTAFVMAQVLSESKKVLYLNLEMFSGITFQSFQEVSSGLSDFIYYLKQRKSNLAMKLQALVRKEGGVDLLYPAEHYNDLYALDIQDIQLLLEELQSATAYDVVIFDIGFMSDAILELLEASCCIYMPFSVSKRNQQKEERFFRFLKEEGKGYIKEKCRQIKVPVDLAVEEETYLLSKSKDSVIGNYLKEMLSGGGNLE